MSKILIRDCIVLANDADGGYSTSNILIENDRIVAVGQSAQDTSHGARVIDGRNRLVVPGLVNAHTHSASAILGGTLDGLSHPAFMWRNLAASSYRTPREIRICTLLSDAAMLLSGTTSAIDHYSVDGHDLPAVSAVMGAHSLSGLRVALGIRVYDEEFTDILPASAELPEGVRRELEQNQPLPALTLDDTRDLLVSAVAEWHGRDGRLQIFPAPSNPLRCSDALLWLCGELSLAHNLGIHMHLLETKVQADVAKRRYGTTNLRYLHGLGLLTDRLSCAHSVWVEADDIELMAKCGVVVVHNPEANLKLGSGIAPIPAMLKAGVTVALGTDGQGANDNASMHEAMRFAALLSRADKPRTDWIRAADAFDMATLGGAAALRLTDQLGQITPGHLADLVLYDLNNIGWTPLNDPVQRLVFSETGTSVNTVLVGGRIVVENGRLTTFDLDELLIEARPLLAEVLGRNKGSSRLADQMVELFP